MPTSQVPYSEQAESSQRRTSRFEAFEEAVRLASRWAQLVHPPNAGGDRPSVRQARDVLYREKMHLIGDAAKLRVEERWPGLFDQSKDREAWVVEIALRVAVELGLPDEARTPKPATSHLPLADRAEPAEEVEQIMVLLRPLAPDAIEDVLRHVTRRLLEEDLYKSAGDPAHPRQAASRAPRP
ncbi:hypothetical protein EDD29_5442 [Actinocorallia herbida]|uniref:Uncharacterized protein n=1 Tax=Actinocorallia herbida TaxID=58109 RepID=A0A3N1D2T5_9ACTN|nr:hypothetical protein [Actinocorallia herbida]ROO87800.1 hypothetical protein EDD29_5442 [Actinocorallia herbida]